MFRITSLLTLFITIILFTQPVVRLATIQSNDSDTITKDTIELTSRPVNSKAKITMEMLDSPTTKTKTKWWVYILEEGTLEKLYSVPNVRSAPLVKNVGMLYLKDRIEYHSIYGKPGKVMFERYDDVLLFIGVGSEIEFDNKDWIEFFGTKYKEGGFKVTNSEVVFKKGTKNKSENTILIFNGVKWTR